MSAHAIINIAKAQLGLDEDTYRALLMRVTGKESLRAMTAAEHLDVINDMKRLGFKVQGRTTRLALSTKPYVRMIHALWKSCHRLGVVNDGSRKALRAFCHRFIAHGEGAVAVDPDLLTYDQAGPIIEALKKMESRGRAAAKAGRT
jgi:phage gp16-like protein